MSESLWPHGFPCPRSKAQQRGKQWRSYQFLVRKSQELKKSLKCSDTPNRGWWCKSWAYWFLHFIENKSITQRIFFENAMKQCKFRVLNRPSTEADKQGNRQKTPSHIPITTLTPPKHHQDDSQKPPFQPPSTGKDFGFSISKKSFWRRALQEFPSPVVSVSYRKLQVAPRSKLPKKNDSWLRVRDGTQKYFGPSTPSTKWFACGWKMGHDAKYPERCWHL